MQEVAKEKTYLETILNVMKKLPLVTTYHISLLFPNHKKPQKAASKYLVRLKKQKLIEGIRMPSLTIGMKIWKLTSQGRLETNAKCKNVPLKSMKFENYLGFADVYFALGQPKVFYAELREPMGDTHFDPDIFTIYNKKAYLIEVQMKPQSQKEWSDKWKKWNIYFNENHFHNASWQQLSNKGKMIPEIVVITRQVKEQVSSGFNVLDKMTKKELIVIKKISDLVV